MARPHRIVSELNDRIESLEIEFHQAYWDSQIDISEENDRRRAELETQLRKVKGDPAALEDVQGALSGELHDEEIRRQLEVLRMSLTANQMTEEERNRVVELSTEVESAFGAHRPEVDGERLNDNQIEEILKTADDDQLRRAVWYGSKEIGGIVADRVRELARVRNGVAHNLGYADFYRMELDLQEISEEWLFGIMDELEKLTDDPFKAWKQALDARLTERFDTSTLYPWHYADPFFQNIPPEGGLNLDELFEDADAAELALRTFDAWEIDLRVVVENSDLYPRDRKCQHAFCLDVDRKRDVRLLCNIVPGERWIEVMLHESGHAAYDVSIDRHLPYLLRRPTHTFVTEAMAISSGRLVLDPAWLRIFSGIEASKVDELAPELRRTTATQSLVFSRWGLVMVHFERALYADPEGDLDALWWELVERFQGQNRPPEMPRGAWTSKIHMAAAPVYYHNYLLGEMLASQLRSTAEREHGGLVGSPEAGKMLIDRVFRPGNLVPWDALIKDATGESLTAEYLAADLLAGLPVSEMDF